MGVVRRQSILMIVSAITVRVPEAGAEHDYVRFSIAIGQSCATQPGPFGFQRRRPGTMAVAIAMRPIMSGLPQEPGQEHQGSQGATDATANPAGHNRGVIRAPMRCPRPGALSSLSADGASGKCSQREPYVVFCTGNRIGPASPASGNRNLPRSGGHPENFSSRFLLLLQSVFQPHISTSRVTP